MNTYNNMSLQELREAFYVHEPDAQVEFIGRNGNDCWMVKYRENDGNFVFYGNTERQAWTKALNSREAK